MREAASFIASRSTLAPEGFVLAAGRAIATAFHVWSTRRSLSRLTDFDDHMLADIGLTREDVRWALDAPFWRQPVQELERRALRSRQDRWRRQD